jgi:hypothetical protein
VAVGLAPGEANKILDALCRAVNYTAPTAFWLQLHVGDPGAAGTANIAGNATRKQVTFGTAAAGGAISNTAVVAWSAGEVDTTESYSHWSVWSASSGGTFIHSGTATGVVTAGDQFQLPIGSVDLSFPVTS